MLVHVHLAGTARSVWLARVLRHSAHTGDVGGGPCTPAGRATVCAEKRRADEARSAVEERGRMVGMRVRHGAVWPCAAEARVVAVCRCGSAPRDDGVCTRASAPRGIGPARSDCARRYANAARRAGGDAAWRVSCRVLSGQLHSAFAERSCDGRAPSFCWTCAEAGGRVHRRDRTTARRWRLALGTHRFRPKARRHGPLHGELPAAWRGCPRASGAG